MQQGSPALRTCWQLQVISHPGTQSCIQVFLPEGFQQLCSLHLPLWGMNTLLQLSGVCVWGGEEGMEGRRMGERRRNEGAEVKKRRKGEGWGREG